MRLALSFLLCSGILVFAMSQIPALGKERSEIDAKYKWDLTALYPSDEAWEAARQSVAVRIPKIEQFKGHLGESADKLHAALSTLMEVSKDLDRLRNYASQTKDQDLRVAKSLEMNQSVQRLMVELGAASSFLQPEILGLAPATVRGFVAADPRLKDYSFFLENILRFKPHTLSPAEEKVAALASDFAGTGQDVHGILLNADLPWPKIKLKSGDEVTLNQAGYSKYRAVPDRDDRLAIFKEFFAALETYKRTVGTTLDGQVKYHIFNKTIHNYDSCLEASLFHNNVPVSVYKQLIADVHANLPTLHRYLKLRQKMMGLPDLRYEDLYAPLVKGVERHFTPEEAMDLTLKATAPLGREYTETLGQGFKSGWIDWLPSTGKRSGAYSTIAYGTHPYQLQNFTGNYDEVSTLAHESGHSLHSYLSDKHQPYVSHDYSIFVAEVASTLNEDLLFRYMLGHAKDDDERLALLGAHVDLLRTTLFRQTMFAEFELLIHEAAERGEPLSGEKFNQIYLELVRKYYGHDQGVCQVDPQFAVEWAYIPHFYYNFYVFQYSTSLTASISIGSRILAEAQAAPASTQSRDAYLKMLAMGSSSFPIDQLKRAGVDMTTSVPFNAAMVDMNATIDMIEQILAKQSR